MMDPDRQIWTGMLAHLRTTQPNLCRQWFEELEPLGIAGGMLRLRAATAIHRDYLQRQCLEPFNDAARTVSGRLLSVRFVGPEDVEMAGLEPVEPELTGNAGPDTAMNGPLHASSVAAGFGAHDGSLVINPDHVFENFVVGPGNRLAHAAAMAVTKDPGRAYNPFFIHGGVGLGKTHLLQAISLRIHGAKAASRIYYTSCEGFMTQFMDAVQAGQMAQFRHKFRDVDMLVIDDIHFLAKRDRTQEEFFHTFNALHQAGKQIVLSSDAPPEEIPELEERLVSRFKCGLVTSIAAPCYETRVAILKNKAKLRGLGFPDDVACYIAAKIDSNIRELEGAITKCQMLGIVEHKPIDLELAKIALGETAERTTTHVTIQMVVTVVVDHYGVRLADLQSKRRQRSIALPRQVCMFLARRHTRHSLEEVGRYFGGRDHTTVMHACRIIEIKSAQDPEFAEVLQSLDERLPPSASPGVRP
jgi:chromosomal replication initiator protein